MPHEGKPTVAETERLVGAVRVAHSNRGATVQRRNCFCDKIIFATNCQSQVQNLPPELNSSHQNLGDGTWDFTLYIDSFNLFSSHGTWDFSSTLPGACTRYPLEIELGHLKKRSC